jgi:inosine-uridine nucleoside N-ribohydrolase
MHTRSHQRSLLTVLIVLFGFMTTIFGTNPVKIILDTDLGPDSDDAGALAVLHALSMKGEAEILAIMCSTKNPWCAPCADAINTYYHRPDIPVGTLKGEGSMGGSEEWYGDSFNGYIAGYFENDIRHGEYAPDAVRLYREILVSQPGTSVHIVVTGPLTNIRDLLVSKADHSSELNGRDLILQKVKYLSVMGGKYPAGSESNFMVDPRATKYVVENWPTPIMFSGYEIGEELLTGQGLDEATPEDNPVRLAYHLWDLQFARRFEKDFDPETGIWPHSSYDQTAVLFAVRGLRNYWTAVSEGSNTIHTDGSNRWQVHPDKDHAYLVELMSREKLAGIIEELMIIPPVGSR